MRSPEHSPSVGFVSLGCAKNLVDAQTMADAVLAAGLRLAPVPEHADVVVVNTCAFIREAREESLGEIRRVCAWKRAGARRAVVVAGCLPQRYRGKAAAALPEVDAFVGLDELDQVGEVARRAWHGEAGVMAVTPGASRRLFPPAAHGVVLTGGAYAYLKIAEGCAHGCTFCAIPAIRGPQRSQPADRILRQAAGLLDRGIRELVLVAQDVTAYGRDLGDGSSLPRLLRALSRFGGRYWIRWLYGFPDGVSDELLETMAALPRVCRYLDVPIQHSHPDILRRMGRARTARAVSRMAERVRNVMPDAVLRTTCLVGFPGETRGHFEHLLNFVRSQQFDHLGVFCFSPEEGTAASRFDRRPRSATAERRRQQLLVAQQSVAAARLKPLVGRQDSVLLERCRGGGRDCRWIGRSSRFAPEVDGHVVVSGGQPGDRMGAFVPVRYTGRRGYDLLATREPNGKAG